MSRVGGRVFIRQALVPLSSVAAAATGTPSLVPNRGGCLVAPKPSPPLTATQVNVLNEFITAEVSGNQEGGGACAGGPVTVTLLPGREWLAQRLTKTYATKVSITISLTHWDGQPGKSATCGVLPKPKTLPSDVTMAFIPRTKSVTSGADFYGSVRISNRGHKPFISTGTTLSAFIVRPGTRRVDAIAAGLEVTARRPTSTVKPGHSTLLSAWGGTERCDGGIGSAIPPGNYEVVVEVGIGTTEREGPLFYLTPPVPIRVTTYHHPKG
jgi:hypothetical protein